jgi:hypothetical protein
MSPLTVTRPRWGTPTDTGSNAGSERRPGRGGGGAEVVFVSAATIWEIEIKRALADN